MTRDEALMRLRALEEYGRVYHGDIEAVLWALKHIETAEQRIAEKDAALDRIVHLARDVNRAVELAGYIDRRPGEIEQVAKEGRSK